MNVLRLLAGLTFGLALLSSCNKEKVENSIDKELLREEQVVRELKFLPLESQDKLRAFHPENQEGNGLNLVVVRVKFGRKSKGCSGFGICYVDWFPDFMVTTAPSQPEKLDPALLETYLKENSSGEKFIELPLATSPSPRFTGKDLELKVDKPLELISNGEDSLDEGLVLPAKTYKFDSNVGSNGGYKIQLEKAS